MKSKLFSRNRNQRDSRGNGHKRPSIDLSALNSGEEIVKFAPEVNKVDKKC